MKTTDKKIVYVAHPIGGNVEENLKDLARILKIINTNSHPKNPDILDKKIADWHYSDEQTGVELMNMNDYIGLSREEYEWFIKDPSLFDQYDFSNIVPIAPYYADIIALDDNDPQQRARGMLNDVTLIETGVFDELWLTGEKISKGMAEEVKLFIKQAKPIKYLIGAF